MNRNNSGVLRNFKPGGNRELNRTFARFTTIQMAEEIRVRASIEVSFAALLDQFGQSNQTQADKPMPMKLEAWPGGRWYRDLRDNNGHYWGTFEAIEKPVLL